MYLACWRALDVVQAARRWLPRASHPSLPATIIVGGGKLVTCEGTTHGICWNFPQLCPCLSDGPLGAGSTHPHT